MRHYVPIQTQKGWAVAYLNHRNELIPVVEFNCFQDAYDESAKMTLKANKEALTA